MKTILISIPPERVAKILSGEITALIRKTAPKCDLPVDVHIYCAKSGDVLWTNVLTDNFYLNLREEHVAPGVEKRNGKVVAKFTLRKITKIEWYADNCGGYFDDYDTGYTTDDDDDTPSKIIELACIKESEFDEYLDGKDGYAWYVSDLVIFDKPKELSEFHRSQAAKMLPDEGDLNYVLTKKPITRAPRSWQYAEVEA